MTKVPNVRLIALLIVAGLFAFLPARPSLAAGYANEPGLTPWVYASFTQCSGTYSCKVTSPAVPTGMRLVIQHVSARGNFVTQGTYVIFTVTNSLGLLVAAASPPLTWSGFTADLPLAGYADAGTTFTFEADSNIFVAGLQVTLTGYLIDCTVQSCAGIYYDIPFGPL